MDSAGTVQERAQEPLGEAPDIKGATALLIAYLPIYDSYHNQKEAIIFAFTAFYLSGASALLVMDKPFWGEYDRFMLLSFKLLIAAVCILGLAFVWWLSRLRRSAGVIYQACSTILTRWAANPPKSNAIMPTEVRFERRGILRLLGKKKVPLMSGFCWPSDLASEIQSKYKSLNPFWLPRDISCLAILLWTVAVGLRVQIAAPH